MAWRLVTANLFCRNWCSRLWRVRWGSIAGIPVVDVALCVGRRILVEILRGSAVASVLGCGRGINILVDVQAIVRLQGKWL